MLKNSLMAALVMLGGLHIAGGESAAEQCRRVNEQCPIYERTGLDCFPCDAKNNCERASVAGWCANAYYTIGATGTAVKKMQQALKEKSFDVDVTGKFDDRTKKAIESFQKQLKLPVDGIAGPETLRKLAQ